MLWAFTYKRRGENVNLKLYVCFRVTLVKLAQPIFSVHVTDVIEVPKWVWVEMGPAWLDCKLFVPIYHTSYK